jgi:hypothetical protein
MTPTVRVPGPPKVWAFPRPPRDTDNGNTSTPDVPTPYVAPPPVYRQPPVQQAPPPPPPPPPPLPPAQPRVELLSVTKSNTGVALAEGQGCLSGAPVTVVVDGDQVATTVADSQGGFKTTFSTATITAGQHDVQALCGPTLNALLDMILISKVGSPIGAAAMLLLVLLLVAWLLRSRLSASNGLAL